MSRFPRLHPRASHRQQPTLAVRPVQVGIPESPFLTEAEAASYTRRFHGQPRLFQRWARKWGLPCVRVGRARQYRTAVLDAFLEQAPWTRRHRKAS